MALPIPDLATQIRSAGALDALLQAKANAFTEATRLRTFRSVLLAALLTQRIEIPESYDVLLDDAVEVPA